LEAVNPDVFITIAFCSYAVLFASVLAVVVVRAERASAGRASGPAGDYPRAMTSKTTRTFGLSKRGIVVFRIAGGIAGLTVGLVLLIGGYSEKSLALALTALGSFILGHAVVEMTYHAVIQEYADSDVGGLRDFASAFVATSGVILGLLAVFGDKTLKTPFTIKVGVVALVSDILIGTVLVGLLLGAPADSDQRAWNLIRYVFHLALWALSLGLLCITMALVYR
jgi:hypothetical protein